MLIQILQAARNSQDEKVMSLIHNLKKTRKKRGRKSKNDIFGITSTTTPSANYVMNENYHPQHESMPYQWVNRSNMYQLSCDKNKTLLNVE